MFDHPNPLRIMVPVAILVMFIFAEGLCRRFDEYKEILLKDGEDDVIVSAESNINLKVKCDYSGDSRKLSFEWKKIINNKWTAVPPNEVLSKSKWLTLENMSFDNRGKYSCSINGSQGNRTFTEKRGFVLKLPSGSYGFDMSEPSFERVNPKEIPILVNSTLRLNCPFFTVADAEFSWYKNDQLLVERKTYVAGMYYGHIDNEYYSPTTSKYSDSGNYTCVVQNSLGSIRHSFSVVVYARVSEMPLSFEYPRDLSLKSGESAIFYNRAFDYGSNVIQWYFLNGTNPTAIDIETVDLSQFKKMEDDIDVKLSNNKLQIDKVTIDNAGWYICVLYGYNKMLMAEAKLEVDKLDVATLDVAKSDVDKTLTEVISEYLNQNKKMSDDEHFLLSLLPMFSTLPMEKKLTARIAIETSLLNIGFRDLNTVDKCHAAAEQNNTTQKSSTLNDKRNQTTEEVDQPGDLEEPSFI